MFAGIYQDKKVLITGNTGFKGSWLTLWLLELGADVYGISIGVPTNPAMFDKLALAEKINYHQQDIRDLSKIADLVSTIKPDFVFHLAAQSIVGTSYLEPHNTMMTNIIGTANILESLRLSNHPCSAIIITSDKCYDNVEWTWGYRENDALGGKDPYSASKASAELIVKSYFHSYFSKEHSNVKISSVRAGNVIGGGDWAENRLVPDCMKSWNKTQAVEIRNPASTRPWQHVLEPLSGYLQVGQFLAEGKNINGEAYNFGPNPDQCFTVLELLNDISLYWKNKGKFSEYQILPSHNFKEAKLLKLCCDKALNALSWRPNLTYKETVDFVAEWYLQFYNNNYIYQLTLEQIRKYEQFAKLREIAWVK